MHILGLKKCREPRDYIFALGGMIGFKEDDSRPLLARDHFEHFCSLATHALRMGDYTPLLLSPLPEEQSVPRAPWLRGHPGMSELLWDLGVCHRRARRQDIVKDGLIQPILEAVGVVEWFEHRNFAGSPETVLMDITPQILLSSGTCPEAFGAAVDRILIRTEDTALYTEWESPYIRKPPRPPYDHSSLVKILQEFSTLQHGTESEQTALQKLDLSGRIIELLDLENPGKKAADSRLDIAHAQAQWYTDKNSQRHLLNRVMRFNISHQLALRAAGSRHIGQVTFIYFGQRKDLMLSASRSDIVVPLKGYGKTSRNVAFSMNSFADVWYLAAWNPEGPVGGEKAAIVHNEVQGASHDS
ncbi:hypothetical protein ACJ41O_013027 [Fusarium nematophilum]